MNSSPENKKVKLESNSDDPKTESDFSEPRTEISSSCNAIPNSSEGIEANGVFSSEEIKQPEKHKIQAFDKAETEPQTVQRNHYAGYAEIKEEFLVPYRTESVDSSDPLNNSRPRHVRGQNKHRKKAKRPEEKTQLCPTLANPSMQDIQCKFGPDKCRFLHDVKQYLSTKPPDIDNLECPFFATRGRCPYGVTCRCGEAHIDRETGESKTNEEKWAEWKSGKFPPGTDPESRFFEINCSGIQFQKKLRQKRYDFSACEAYLKQQQEEQAAQTSNSSNNNNVETVEKQANDSSSIGPCPTEDIVLTNERERKKLDFSGKLYLAPLTTVGNLPFRRVCVGFGAEITCSEMAMSTSLLAGTQSEWSLVRRHESEKIFGIQVCGSHANTMMMASTALAENFEFDFLDINMGCPIDLVCNKGAGCSLMTRVTRLGYLIDAMHTALKPKGIPLTLKFRTGMKYGQNTAHNVLQKLKDGGKAEKLALYTLHGRSKEQRYTKMADWDYIHHCARVGSPVPLFGCGDVLSFEDYYQQMESESKGISGIMIARGALIKPWIFQEIHQKRHWDISSSERLDILRDFSRFGLEHWGSDQQGVEKTRRFLLEWLSFLHRYIPVGILEQVPQKINLQPPKYVGRNDLETLMGSNRSLDWIKISEMLLGPVPDNFEFVPKHKANSY